MMTLPSFNQLSDQDLLREVTRLAAREREATARLIASLAELDRRRLYLSEGCASLFVYCVHVLHLSEHAAYDRIEVARAARRFPIVLAQLAAGSVTLTTVRLLAPHLTDENHTALLAEARHRTRRDVEQIVARLQPRPDVPSTVRKLPTPTPPPPDTPEPKSSSVDVPRANTGEAPPRATPPSPASGPPPPAPAPTRPAVVAPLTPTRYKVSFTISAETYAKLQEAQALLRHVIPSGDLALIFDRALTLLVAESARTKHAATNATKPRRPTASGDSLRLSPLPAVRGNVEPVDAATDRGRAVRSRHIPAEVKRTVWARDSGRCAFVSASGRRCAERGFLEFHHVVPYAKGGEASVDNIQLRCKRHNGYEAERDFGLWPTRVRETPPIFRVAPDRTRFETSLAQLLCHPAGAIEPRVRNHVKPVRSWDEGCRRRTLVCGRAQGPPTERSVKLRRKPVSFQGTTWHEIRSRLRVEHRRCDRSCSRSPPRH
jgi:5-methylcytosine-specific restriction endonuclease McrA